METFSIEAFATTCKRAMAEAEDPRAAARRCLEDAIERHGPAEIIAALEAAIPPLASIGELIVHASPELTMLYGMIPPRFQSGIHDHTVCACIGQLEGEEVNHIFEPSEDGSLKQVRSVTVRPGEVLELDRDVIHCIENPGTEVAHALHLYAGDFGAIAERRSLWSWEGHERRPFSFPALLGESATAMHRSGNREGLAALAEAMPASRALIDTLK